MAIGVDYGWFGGGLVLLLGLGCAFWGGALIFSILVYSLRHGLFVFGGFIAVLIILFLMGLDSEQGWQYRQVWSWLWSGLIGAATLFALIMATRSLIQKQTDLSVALIVFTIWVSL